METPPEVAPDFDNELAKFTPRQMQTNYCNGIVKVDTSKSIIYNQQIQGGVQ